MDDESIYAYEWMNASQSSRQLIPQKYSSHQCNAVASRHSEKKQQAAVHEAQQYM